MPINQKQCPLCSGDNACGARDDSPCWCCRVGIPQGLLDLVPAEQQMKTCICQACVARFQQAQQPQAISQFAANSNESAKKASSSN